MSKLVRNNIPQIIESSGKRCEWHYFNIYKGGIYDLIIEKMKEEFQELLDASTKEEKIEELADLCEIALKYCEMNRIGLEEVLYKVIEKRKEKGNFDALIILDDVQ